MNSINDFKEKINPVLESSKNLQYRISPFYTLILMIIIASIFFALGRISVLNSPKQPIKIIDTKVSGESQKLQTANVLNSQTGNLSNNTNQTDSGIVVGSKTSNKYYYPWCGTAKRIKPENLITFSSIEEARSKGYIPGGNCAGLK